MRRCRSLLVPLLLAIGVAQGDACAEEGWVALFDGRTLHGWVQRNGTAEYLVEDGAIVGRTSEGSPNSFLTTEQTYGDFELEFEVKVDDALNSGVQIRSGTKERATGERPDDRVAAFPGHEPTDDEQPATAIRRADVRAGVTTVAGAEQRCVDATRDDARPVHRSAHGAELGHLVRASRDDPVDLPGELALEVDAVGRARVVRSLVALLDRPQGVEGLGDRNVQPGAGVDRRKPRHPEVGVHDIRPQPPPAAFEIVSEIGHVRQQFVLGQRHRGPGVDVVDDDAGVQPHLPRERRIVASGVHDHVRPK